MNININNIRLISFCKSEKWTVSAVLTAIITGVIIATEKWLYMGILIIPIIILVCNEKAFVFPFGFYVLLLPFESILTVTGGSQGATLTRFLGILTILVLAFKGVFEDKLKRPDKPAMLLMLFIMYGILSFFWSQSPEKVISSGQTLISLFILYIVISSYKIRKSELNTLKWFIIIGGLLAAINTINIYLSGDFFSSDARATMMSGEQSSDPNRFAFTLIIPVAICVQMIIEQKVKALKVILSFSLAIFLFCIIITGSRGASLSIGIIFLAFMFNAKQKITLVAILIIVGTLLMSFIPDLYFDRWGDAVESGGTGRLDIWYVGWYAFKKYYLFGAGLNNFPVAFDEFGYHKTSLKTGFGAHNIFIGLSVELGIIGIMLFGLAIREHYRTINSRVKKLSNDASMLKGSFWGILLASFFLDTVYLKSFWLLWMMIMMHKNVIEGEQQSKLASN